jgi:ABC-type lipoprotein export system ATPase subunit
VALCRALIKGPSLILADEPTGNLDAESSQLVIDGLRQSALGGATVIIASHDAGVVGACDRVLAL